MGGKEKQGGLTGVEGGENIIKIHCKRIESIFNKKKNIEILKLKGTMTKIKIQNTNVNSPSTR